MVKAKNQKELEWWSKSPDLSWSLKNKAYTFIYFLHWSLQSIALGINWLQALGSCRPFLHNQRYGPPGYGAGGSNQRTSTAVTSPHRCSIENYESICRCACLTTHSPAKLKIKCCGESNPAIQLKGWGLWNGTMFHGTPYILGITFRKEELHYTKLTSKLTRLKQI